MQKKGMAFIKTTALNDYCILTRPEWIGSIEEAAFYDCLCAENKEDKECK